jgi:glycine cleavage system H protein
MSDHNLPEELKYTKTHEWSRLEGEDEDVLVIGITDHAQQLLGDMVFVELPDVGDQVGSGDEIGVVESVKAASDFYAPVSGEVIAVNSELQDAPALVNTDAYGDGWLVKIRMDDPEEFEDLMSAEDYEEILSDEE